MAEVGAAYKDTSHSPFRTILSLWALPLYLLYALLTEETPFGVTSRPHPRNVLGDSPPILEHETTLLCAVAVEEHELRA